MSEYFVSLILMMVLFGGMMAMLGTNVWYVYRAYRTSLGEGIACLMMMFVGYIVYFLVKLLKIDLPIILFEAISNISPGIFGKPVLVGIVFSMGWIVGFFYRKQAARNTYLTFRLVLPLLAVMHGLLADIFFYSWGSTDASQLTDLYPSIVFILGVIISWAIHFPGTTDGNAASQESNEVDPEREVLETEKKKTDSGDGSLPF